MTDAGKRTLIGFCFFLSGLAALLYETVWFRQLASVVGASEAATGAVLAGYMGGMALGAALAAKWAQRVRRRVLAYGLLELGVAVGALLMPVGIMLLESLRSFLLGGQPEPAAAGSWSELAFNFLATSGLLLIPTTCMGATLPLLAGSLSSADSIDATSNRQSSNNGQLAWLYAINTLGAVCGTLGAAFVCLPQLGLTRTVWIGALLNAAVFVIAFVVERRDENRAGVVSLESQPTLDLVPTSNVASRRLLGFWTCLVAVSSSLVFVCEVVWTRLLSHVLGGSVYAFATMLAAFLLGLAGGGIWASRWTARRTASLTSAEAGQQHALRGVVVGLLAASLGTAVALITVPWLPSWHHSLISLAGSWSMLGSALLCLGLLLPSTLGMGMVFPLALDACGGTQASASTGRLTAASTIGAIVGALTTGHWWLPLLGFKGTLAVVMSVDLLLVLAAWSEARDAFQRGLDRVFALRFGLVSIVAAGLLVGAKTDSLMRLSPLVAVPLEGRIVHATVGASSTVAVVESHGERRLLTNGLPESVIAPRGAVAGAEAGLRWLTALPYLARPKAESVLIVGFGGGGAVSGVPSSVPDIDAIEIEPEVVNALRHLGRKRLHDPLGDSRLKLIFNDARAALRLTTKRYDIIVSQPSHPWTAGASHLYTQEFLQLARSHLTEDGVLLQWMDARFVDVALVRTIAATLLGSFEHARLYQPHPGTLLFLASNGELDVERGLHQSGELLRSSPPQLQWLGLNDVTDLAAALTLDESGLRAFAANAVINTDDENRLAFRSARPSGLAQASELQALDWFSAWDPLVTGRRTDQVDLATQLQLDPALIVRRLMRTGFADRASSVADSLRNSVDQARARGLLATSKGQLAQARTEFVSVLEARPTDRWARFKLVESLLQANNLRQPSREFVQLVSASSALDTAVVEAAQRYFAQDFSGLASLDGQLAVARPTDPCFSQALCFRALWRGKVTNAARKTEAAREAIELADRALAVEPSLFVAMARQSAAKQLPESDWFVESVAYVVHLIQSQPGALSRDAATRWAKQTREELERRRAAAPALADRLQEVVTLVSQIEAAASVER